MKKTGLQCADHPWPWKEQLLESWILCIGYFIAFIDQADPSHKGETDIYVIVGVIVCLAPCLTS